MSRYLKHLLTLPGDLRRYGDTFTFEGAVWCWTDDRGWTRMSATADASGLPDHVYRHPFPLLRLLLWLVCAFLVIFTLQHTGLERRVDLSVQLFLFSVPLMNRKAFLLDYYFKEEKCGASR